MVVSHERSGTHFLMNSLAACYGYTSNPFINFDRPDVEINYCQASKVRQVLLALAARPMANVVKSHHAVDFFKGELNELIERYVLFVICRHPAPVMVSFWRFMHEWNWNEGPKTDDPITFARSEPCGGIMRYQMRQAANMLRRWASHVEGWLDAAAEFPRIVVVRYEDLDADYERTVRGFEAVLGHPPQALVRPARDRSVILPGHIAPKVSDLPPDMEALRELCRAQVGPTMSRLGYE